MAILRGESSTNKIKTNNNKEFNRPPRRIFDSEAKDVLRCESSTKKTLEIFSFIKVCYYYNVLKYIYKFVFNAKF